MQFLSSEIWSIFGYAFGGALVASAWRAADLHLQHRSNTNDLDPDPEAIRAVDTTLFQLLVQLQEYRYVHRSAFINLVLNADRLCVLLDNLNKVSEDHLRRGHLYYECARDDLEKMSKKAMKSKQVKESHAIAIEKKLKHAIESRLEALWVRVQNKFDIKA
jgi:5'-3' exonuclease